jgi:Uma2 family endonuclease
MTTAAISASASTFAPGQRLFTVADVAMMPTQLPSGPVDYELDNGRLLPMSPTGRRHGQIQSAIAAELHVQGQQRGLGVALVESGVVLWRNPDRMVGPNVSFVTRESLPIRESVEGFLETIPELVVEVRSKNDSNVGVDAKVRDYLEAGVRCQWIVDPAVEAVFEHRRDVQTRSFSKADTLECEDVIPGFRLALADLFQQ